MTDTRESKYEGPEAGVTLAKGPVCLDRRKRVGR